MDDSHCCNPICVTHLVSSLKSEKWLRSPLSLFIFRNWEMRSGEFFQQKPYMFTLYIHFYRSFLLQFRDLRLANKANIIALYLRGVQRVSCGLPCSEYYGSSRCGQYLLVHRNYDLQTLCRFCLPSLPQFTAEAHFACCTLVHTDVRWHCSRELPIKCAWKSAHKWALSSSNDSLYSGSRKYFD